MSTIIKMKQGHREEVQFTLGEGQELTAVLDVLGKLEPIDQHYSQGYHNVFGGTSKITVHINESVLTEAEFDRIKAKHEEEEKSD